jgi:hypothetical protein
MDRRDQMAQGGAEGSMNTYSKRTSASTMKYPSTVALFRSVATWQGKRTFNFDVFRFDDAKLVDYQEPTFRRSITAADYDEANAYLLKEIEGDLRG